MTVEEFLLVMSPLQRRLFAALLDERYKKQLVLDKEAMVRPAQFVFVSSLAVSLASAFACPSLAALSIDRCACTSVSCRVRVRACLGPVFSQF
jgi:hypothetical protein